MGCQRGRRRGRSPGLLESEPGTMAGLGSTRNSLPSRSIQRDNLCVHKHLDQSAEVKIQTMRIIYLSVLAPFFFFKQINRQTLNISLRRFSSSISTINSDYQGQSSILHTSTTTQLTSIIREVAELLRLQPLPQRSHPPLAAEEHVSPAVQSAQLLHAPLFGPPILEPHLQGKKKKKKMLALMSRMDKHEQENQGGTKEDAIMHLRMPRRGPTQHHLTQG